MNNNDNLERELSEIFTRLIQAQRDEDADLYSNVLNELTSYCKDNNITDTQMSKIMSDMLNKLSN